MRKFTDEEVRNCFEAAGYVLLDTYVDCKTKMRFRCPHGHEAEITFDSFKRGKRCILCRLNEASERYRHPYEKIKKEFEDAGCELLSSTYINGRQKLDYICSCGNRSQIRYSDFHNGKRCNQCAIDRR